MAPPPRIELVEYTPEWPVRFEAEAARIRRAVGAQVIGMEHIGSTSVPGLIAKPVIDILLVVADSAAEPTYVPALEGIGYVLRVREPDWHEHRMLKGPNKDVNLHVYSAGSEEIERYLLLRDRLRSNDADRELYARVKSDLAGKEWKHLQNYADAKTEVIEAIIARAREAASAGEGRRTQEAP
ncbi:MAG TPA: GrpB family protein [Streptosporangiaceae bacterium]